MFTFNETSIKKAFVSKFADRITHLAAAGSIVNGRSNQSSDLDLLIVLKSREPNDLTACRETVQSLSEYKIDLSLKYLDELPKQPEHFQDGPRTALAFAYINSAHFIIGTNDVFNDLFSRLSRYEFQRSILHAVGEYIMRMESMFFTSSDNDLSAVQKQCFKYMTRIIIDTQLFFAPSDMLPYKRLTRPEMLRTGKDDKRIGIFLVDINEDSTPVQLIAAMSSMYIYLKENLLPDKL